MALNCVQASRRKPGGLVREALALHRRLPWTIAQLGRVSQRAVTTKGCDLGHGLSGGVETPEFCILITGRMERRLYLNFELYQASAIPSIAREDSAVYRR